MRPARIVPEQKLHTDRVGLRNQVLNPLRGILPLVPVGIDQNVVPAILRCEVDVLRLKVRITCALAEPGPGRAAWLDPGRIVHAGRLAEIVHQGGLDDRGKLPDDENAPRRCERKRRLWKNLSVAPALSWVRKANPVEASFGHFVEARSAIVPVEIGLGHHHVARAFLDLEERGERKTGGCGRLSEREDGRRLPVVPRSRREDGVTSIVCTTEQAGTGRDREPRGFARDLGDALTEQLVSKRDAVFVRAHDELGARPVRVAERHAHFVAEHSALTPFSSGHGVDLIDRAIRSTVHRHSSAEVVRSRNETKRARLDLETPASSDRVRQAAVGIAGNRDSEVTTRRGDGRPLEPKAARLNRRPLREKK